MSSQSKIDFKEFIKQNAYLLVFTLICGFGLLSYFACNTYFEEIFRKNENYVISSSAVKGVWVNNNGVGCPNIENLDVDRCVESTYLDDFQKLPTQSIKFEDNGRLLFSNNELFVSGVFDKKEKLNEEVWPSVYVGDLNIKINQKQWVYTNIVWDMESDDSILDVLPTDHGYILLLSPSVSMVNRGKRFWVYQYDTNTENISSMSFFKDSSPRVFFESSTASFVRKNSNMYLLFERYDPALMGNVEIELYKVGENLEFNQRILLLNGN